MNIIIIGNGQIGSALNTALSEHNILHWKQDIAELSEAEIIAHKTEAVICAAGRTDLTWCENNPREAFRSNIEAPVELYQTIHALNKELVEPIRYLNFSSGRVWDGPYNDNGEPFTPEYPPTPAALYSWTKAACDELLLREDRNNVAILRPRQVYSPQNSPRNTLMKLIRYPKLVDTDQSLSSIDIIIKTVRYLLNAGLNWAGIWNIYDKGITTPYHIGVMMAEHGLREMPTVLDKAELDTFHKPRRVDTVLYDERFERLIEPDELLPTLKKTIAELKNTL